MPRVDSALTYPVERETRRRLGRYLICRQIAAGGMGRVYLARTYGTPGFDKLVALKCIHSHLAREGDFAKMFMDEARIASRIAHPNVCDVFEFGEENGICFLAMEYLAGQPISSVIRAVARDPFQGQAHRFFAFAARMVAEACEGLHAAHVLIDDEGHPLHVIHRDVSPENLFVTYDGAVRVMDFGIARATGRAHETSAGVFKGKLSYAAPEQFSREELDCRVDVWSAGVVLWELLTCSSLFQRDSELTTMAAVLGDPIPPPSYVRAGVPPELDSIVMTALSRERSLRYSNARAMARDLHQFVANAGPHVGTAELGEWMRDLFSEEYSDSMELIRDARQVDPMAASEAMVLENDDFDAAPRSSGWAPKDPDADHPPTRPLRMPEASSPSPRRNGRPYYLQPTKLLDDLPAPEEREAQSFEEYGASETSPDVPAASEFPSENTRISKPVPETVLSRSELAILPDTREIMAPSESPAHEGNLSSLEHHVSEFHEENADEPAVASSLSESGTTDESPNAIATNEPSTHQTTVLPGQPPSAETAIATPVPPEAATNTSSLPASTAKPKKKGGFLGFVGRVALGFMMLLMGVLFADASIRREMAAKERQRLAASGKAPSPDALRAQQEGTKNPFVERSLENLPAPHARGLLPHEELPSQEAVAPAPGLPPSEAPPNLAPSAEGDEARLPPDLEETLRRLAASHETVEEEEAPPSKRGLRRSKHGLNAIENFEAEAAPAEESEEEVVPELVAVSGGERHSQAPKARPQRTTSARSSGQKGMVNVFAAGGWADVYLGSRKLGRTPGRFELPSGKQTLTLKPQGQEPVKRTTVRVQPNEVVRVVVNLN